MPSPRPRLTPRRITFAALTAWLLPSLILANLIMIGDAFNASGPDADMISAAVTAWTAGPVMGLLMGWPFLLAAFAAWGLLHHWRLATPKVAAGVGLLCGAAAGIALGERGGETQWIFAGPVIGAVTGLAVWRVAYRPLRRSGERAAESPSERTCSAPSCGPAS